MVRLSRREQMLIGILAVVVVCAANYFGVLQLVRYQADLAEALAARKALLARATLVSDTISRLKAEPQSRPRRAPLIGHIEQLAAANGLGERIQLNRVNLDKAKGVEGLDVKLDQLSLDEALAFIHGVEDSQPTLVVESLDITRSFRSEDQLRLSLRILALQ